MRLRPGAFPYSWADIPSPIAPPPGDIRLLIAPVNFAGQAWHWARAASRLPGVSAVNLQYRMADDVFQFRADSVVPTPVFTTSRLWASRHFDAVVGGFTHVLIEAVRPMFGCLFDGDVEAEVAALRSAGLQVGMIIHGSEVRLPRDHARDNPWSPFRSASEDWIDRLERTAIMKRGILDRINAPVFASTTTLRQLVPGAVWLPIAVEPDRWQTSRAPLTSGVPKVVHVPSSGVMKGTELIRAALAPLVEEGRVDYREAQDVATRDMPTLYGDADIVIDAVRMGNYGAAACEAMAAGRITFVYLSAAALDEARRTGIRAPVIATDPARLEAQLREIVNDPADALALAAQGPGFVDEFHDGRRSAGVLSSFLESSLDSTD